MSKKTLEHLSSLMDGETSQETGLFLTRRVCADQDLSQTWERYHLIRDCMRSSGENWTVARLEMQISDLVPDEASTPLGNTENVRRLPGWVKPLGGMAVAASVALVAVMAVAPQVDPGVPEPAAEPFASPSTNSSLSSAPASRTVSDPSMQTYLIRHNRAASSVGRQGMAGIVVPLVASAADTEEELNAANGADEAVEAADGQTSEAQR